MPKFELEDIEDYYTYYVLILQIPEETFFSSELNFIEDIAENKSAYDSWLSYAVRMDGERRHGK